MEENGRECRDSRIGASRVTGREAGKVRVGGHIGHGVLSGGPAWIGNFRLAWGQAMDAKLKERDGD